MGINFATDGFHAPGMTPPMARKRNKGRQSVRVLISFPSEFLTNVDALAAIEGRSRSELVREALRLYLRAYVEKKEIVK